MNDEIDRSGHRSATIDPGREGHFDRSRTGKPALSEIGVELSERTDLPVAGYPKLETRELPFTERLRLLWLRQIPRGSARR